MLVVALALSAFFAVSYFGIEQLSQTNEQPEAIASADVESHAAALHDLSTGAPYRSVEFSGSDAQIRYGDPITVSVEGVSPSESLSTITITPTPLVYDVGDSRVVSVLGATILEDDSGGMVMQSAPPVQLAPQQSTLRLMETSKNGGSDQVTIGDNREASLSNHRYQTQTDRFEPTDSNGDLETATITVTIQSPRYRAWETFFEDHPQVSSVTISPSSNEVKAEFDSKRILIQRTSINMKLSG